MKKTNRFSWLEKWPRLWYFLCVEYIGKHNSPYVLMICSIFPLVCHPLIFKRANVDLRVSYGHQNSLSLLFVDKLLHSICHILFISVLVSLCVYVCVCVFFVIFQVGFPCQMQVTDGKGISGWNVYMCIYSMRKH